MSEIFIYRLLLRLLFPAIAIATLAIALRDGSSRYLRQRLGRFTGGSTPDKPLWIHCASVGETSAALALTREWLKRHPEDAFVLTTNTVAAAHLLAAQPDSVSRQVRHYYLPLDYPSFCRRFLDVIRPRCALIIETEIWFNLFSLCHDNGVPIFIVNARLSKQAPLTVKILSGYYRRSLALVGKILARTDKDAAAFINLGSEVEKVEVVGNLKFAGGAAGKNPGALPDLVGVRYVLAASTHADEEIQVAKAWEKAMSAGSADSQPLLVIAPRHPYRGKAIEKQLRKRGFSTRRRSRGEKPGNQTTIYIVDTIGELPALIRHADLVFMGGTLVPIGGHNILEPARLGTPQVVGPYTDSFHEEAEALKKARGIIEVNDARALGEILHTAVRTTPPYADIAANALTLMDQREDIAAAYVAAIKAAGVTPPATPA